MLFVIAHEMIDLCTQHTVICHSFVISAIIIHLH